MGNHHSIKKINFEDMQTLIYDSNTLVINTLLSDKQDCLIINTLPWDHETKQINDMLEQGQLNKKMVIYGMNACDEGIVTKYNQMLKLGFTQIYIYPGGLFEWILLQDIYGNHLFPTTAQEIDILRFKGKRCLS
jgi:hypothetical protein